MSGYVRIHRTLIGHPAFRNDAEAMAFAWLVAKAAWKPSRVRYKERGIGLARGQVAISVRDFANAMDRDKAWVERLLKRLKSETMIETVNETGVNVITICKYEDYQAEQDTGKTVPETRARQTQDTEQRREKGKKGSEAKASSPAPEQFSLPADIPAEPWAGYEEMRKKIGHCLTDRARGLAIAELRKLADDGYPPGDVLNHCTLNSYRGIYPPKDQRNGRPPQSNSQPRSRLLDALNATDAELARSPAYEDHAGAWTALPSARAG